VKSPKRAISVWSLYALSAGLVVAWSGGCSLFQPHPPSAPPESHPPPPPQVAPVSRPAIRSRPIRSKSVYIRRPLQPSANPSPIPAPAPSVTLENSDDAKANARRLLDQATVTLAHFNRAELPASTVSTYEQASELINAARRALADQDYLAASGLAEKASALISQLPPRK